MKRIIILIIAIIGLLIVIHYCPKCDFSDIDFTDIDLFGDID